MKVIKRFINKITPAKVVVLIILIFANLFLGYMIVSKITTQVTLEKKLDELKTKIDQPLSENKGNISNIELHRILTSGDSIKGVESITELDNNSKDLRVVKDMSLDDLKRMSESNVIDFTLTSTDIYSTLNYLSKSKIICEYIFIDDKKINCRVLVKGGN